MKYIIFIITLLLLSIPCAIASEPSHEALKDAIDTAKLLNYLLEYE